MPDLQRLHRRVFLSRYGEGALGVAILGSGLIVSCSREGEITEPSSSTSPTAAKESDPEPPVTGDDDSTPEAADGETPVTDPLRWERVDLGFVSAYLLARGNEVTIIDAGTSNNLPAFDDALTAIGASWNSVGRVILTHNHGDHIGGLPQIVEVAPNAKVYIGEADLGALGGLEAQPVNDGDEIFGLQIIGTPGHTAGHISVFDAEAGLLVAGDVINESAGLVLGLNPDFTANMTQGNASVLRLAERQFETVVFGHGNPIESNASAAVVALAQTLG